MGRCIAKTADTCRQPGDGFRAHAKPTVNS